MLRPIQRDAASIRAFFERYGLMGRPLNKFSISHGEGFVPIINQIQGHLTENSESQTNQGKGVVFLFPLTGAGAHYEFFRGVLGILAPKAKAAMVLTPRRKSIDQMGEREPELMRQQLMQIAGEKPHRVIMVDSRGGGNTYRYLSGKVSEVFSQSGITNVSMSHAHRLFDEISEHFRAFGIEMETRSRVWWEKSPAGLKLTYRGVGFDKRSQFAKERLYFYRLGRVYAQAYLRNKARHPDAT